MAYTLQLPDFHVNLEIFYMSQIYDMGPTALLPLQRKACMRIFSPLKIRRLRPGLNPQTWVLKASTQKKYINKKFAVEEKYFAF